MKRLNTVFHVLIYYFVIFILLPYIFIQIGNLYLGHVEVTVPLKITGILFILIGVINSIYSYRLFFTKGNGTPVQTEPSKKIITTGLYRYTRNPIYLGHFLLILGEFLLFGYFSLLIYLILFIVYTHLVIVFIEERGLEKRFGDEYVTYKKSVPRYLSRLF